MRLEALEVRRLAIPFRLPFKHASAERRETETLWVTARTTQGVVGHGEACPRSYVTGESLETAAAFVRDRESELLASIRSASDVERWAASHRAEIDRHPAAWCAVELALLDALGVSSECSVERLLALPELEGSFDYTAVVGDMPADRFRETVELYRKLEMSDFKLKLSGRLDDDRDKLAWLAASARKAERLRLDANNLWNDVGAAASYLESLPRAFFAVEEPLAPNRFRELEALSRRLGVPIVLDESFLRLGQLAPISEASERFIVNVRVSKMGGLLRSLDCVRAARRLGIRIVVGSQVGETSLLTRAALPIAREASDLLLAQEGAFGDWLLAEDPCTPPLAFGRGGVLCAPTPSHGLGLSAGNIVKARRAEVLRLTESSSAPRKSQETEHEGRERSPHARPSFNICG